MMEMSYPPHPHAALFPHLQGDEFQALVEDIRQNGLQRAITLYDGQQVLDGRNRLAACIEAGVEPRFTEFAGTDDEALVFVLSANLHRRHLTTCQRAVLALQLLPGERDRARERKREAAKDRQAFAGAEGKATDVAGQRGGISGESVRQASVIAESTPEVVDAMRDGTVRSMAEAQRLAGFPEERRQRVLDKMRDTGCRLRDADTASTTWSRRGSIEWYTPPELIEVARRVLGGPIDLDPCSCQEAQEIVKAERFFSAEEDGLSQPWEASKLWMNPPQGTVGDKTSVTSLWLDKLFEEIAAGRVQRALVLVRAAVDCAWFDPLWEFPICFIRGRPKFIPAAQHQGTRPNTAVCIAGVNVVLDRFVSEFQPWGKIVIPRGDGTSMPVP